MVAHPSPGLDLGSVPVAGGGVHELVEACPRELDCSFVFQCSMCLVFGLLVFETQNSKFEFTLSNFRFSNFQFRMFEFRIFMFSNLKICIFRTSNFELSFSNLKIRISKSEVEHNKIDFCDF